MALIFPDFLAAQPQLVKNFGYLPDCAPALRPCPGATTTQPNSAPLIFETFT